MEEWEQESRKGRLAKKSIKLWNMQNFSSMLVLNTDLG